MSAEGFLFVPKTIFIDMSVKRVEGRVSKRNEYYF